MVPMDGWFSEIRQMVFGEARWCCPNDIIVADVASSTTDSVNRTLWSDCILKRLFYGMLETIMLETIMLETCLMEC